MKDKSSILPPSDQRILFLTVWESFRCFFKTPFGLLIEERRLSLVHWRQMSVCSPIQLRAAQESSLICTQEPWNSSTLGSWSRLSLKTFSSDCSVWLDSQDIRMTTATVLLGTFSVAQTYFPDLCSCHLMVWFYSEILTYRQVCVVPNLVVTAELNTGGETSQRWKREIVDNQSKSSCVQIQVWILIFGHYLSFFFFFFYHYASFLKFCSVVLTMDRLDECLNSHSHS